MGYTLKGDIINYQCERCKEFKSLIAITHGMYLCTNCEASFRDWYNSFANEEDEMRKVR